MIRTTVTASDGITLAVHAYTEIDLRRARIGAVGRHQAENGIVGHALESLEHRQPPEATGLRLL